MGSAFKRLKFLWSNFKQKQPIQSLRIKQSCGTVLSFLCVTTSSLSMLTVHHTLKVLTLWTSLGLERQKHKFLEAQVYRKPQKKPFFHEMPQAQRDSLTTLILCSISLMNLIVKPHVCNRHAVLCQSACFVRTNSRCGTQGFHSFQILHQAVLTSHALGC